MEITGVVKTVCQPMQGVSQKSGNPWMSQEFIVEIPGQYPRSVCFKAFGNEKIQEFNVRVGETITVAFDIDAHEHNGRWYNSLNAWQVKRQGVYQPNAAPQTAQYAQQPTQSYPQAPQAYAPQQSVAQQFPPQVNAQGVPQQPQQPQPNNLPF